MYMCNCLFYCSYCKCDGGGEEGGVTETQTLKKREEAVWKEMKKEQRKRMNKGFKEGLGKKSSKWINRYRTSVRW